MASNFKSPPALNENSVYEPWKGEIAIWQAFTDLSAEKQGPAIFLTLSGKAREAVLQLDVSKLTDKNGVKNFSRSGGGFASEGARGNNYA